ncbi:hypothetical protein DFH09DRAFT_1105409 [Mycena vulgaris]|nr:hypothetical protein DFH09DRAFT_1105409 [Mycena vulgaris]
MEAYIAPSYLNNPNDHDFLAPSQPETQGLVAEPDERLKAATSRELQTALDYILKAKEPEKTTYKDFVRKLFGRVHGPMKVHIDRSWHRYEEKSRALREGQVINSQSVSPSFQGQGYVASTVPSTSSSQYSGVMFTPRRHGTVPQSAPMANWSPEMASNHSLGSSSGFSYARDARMSDIVVNERARGGIGGTSASQHRLGYYPAPGPSASYSQVQSPYGQSQPAGTSQQQFQGPIPVQDPATGQWWTYDPNGNRVFAPSAQGPWTRYD